MIMTKPNKERGPRAGESLQKFTGLNGHKKFCVAQVWEWEKHFDLTLLNKETGQHGYYRLPKTTEISPKQ